MEEHGVCARQIEFTDGNVESTHQQKVISLYFDSINMIVCTQHLMATSSSMQYAQDVMGLNHCSQYVDADHAVLRRCVAGADGVAGSWFILTTEICIHPSMTASRCCRRAYQLSTMLCSQAKPGFMHALK